MNRYFQEFYHELKDKFDYSIKSLDQKMWDILVETRSSAAYFRARMSRDNVQIPLFFVNSYKTASAHFEVIPQTTITVIVPYGEGNNIIADLNGEKSIHNLSVTLKRAQQFAVNIFSHEFNQLSKEHAIKPLLDGQVYALYETAYHEEYGVDITANSSSSFYGY